MHFFCAKIVGWLVIDKYNCFCGKHKPRNEMKKKEAEAKALANRKISSETEIQKLEQMKTEHISPEKPTPENVLIKTSGKPASFERAAQSTLIKNEYISPTKSPITSPKTGMR
jgi:hypothetical protein